MSDSLTQNTTMAYTFSWSSLTSEMIYDTNDDVLSLYWSEPLTNTALRVDTQFSYCRWILKQYALSAFKCFLDDIMRLFLSPFNVLTCFDKINSTSDLHQGIGSVITSWCSNLLLQASFLYCGRLWLFCVFCLNYPLKYQSRSKHLHLQQVYQHNASMSNFHPGTLW